MSSYTLRPQQTGSPSRRTAQLSQVATAMSRARRSGGTSRLPSTFVPQQVTVSSSLMAQAWLVPVGASGSLGLSWKMAATIFALRPGGGAGGLMPQQTTPSSSLTAQLKNDATASDFALSPSGG